MASSSPPPQPKRFFQSSSPLRIPARIDEDEEQRGRSRFTYRHLAQLAAGSVSCPLRVIAHIDLDAFYAQCEMVRLGVDEDTPLAVQQWQGLIAVNYPARKFGIGRHCTIDDAMKLCPELKCQHVATWREGDDRWAYRDDAAANIATDKVSLDPYRLQSRRILALIKECLPAHQRKVEKASIDEVFIDLSANAHSILMKRFPELANPPGNDPTAYLPLPPTTALDWQADTLVDLNEDETEEDDPDWDDVALLLASEIVRDMRLAIREKLRYTCSAGVAGNKLLSKLGSAHRKPNQQTVIRSRAVRNFLSDFKFTKMRNLGGKLGEQVAAVFGTEAVAELLAVSLPELKAKLGDDATAAWVHDTIRGIDTSEVSARTQIKSMLSAKSFRPGIGSVEQAGRWMRIFAADIFARLVEEGVLENKRRPRTMNLHHRHAGQTRSRSCPIPQGGGAARTLDDGVLFDLAMGLLRQIVAEGKAWPCDNLSLNVAGFEEGVVGNMGIGGFLVKGEEAQALRPGPVGQQQQQQQDQPQQDTKRRRRANGAGGIHRFLVQQRGVGFSAAVGADEAAPGYSPGMRTISKEESRKRPLEQEEESPGALLLQSDEGKKNPQGGVAAEHGCPRCGGSGVSFEDEDGLRDHLDWHMAVDLQAEEERGASAFAGRAAAAQGATSSSSSTTTAGRGGGRRSGRGGGRSKAKAARDPGQTRLSFG